jgi:hypothetical protein
MKEEACEPKPSEDSPQPQVTVAKIPKPPPPEQKEKPAPAANDEPANSIDCSKNDVSGTSKTQAEDGLETTLGAPTQVMAELRGKILEIITSDLPSLVKRQSIEEEVTKALSTFGTFYRLEGAESHDTSMFFNSITKRLERLKSDWFTSWLSRFLALNQADSFFKVAYNGCLNEAMAGKNSASVDPEAYWASRSCAVYISSGPGQMCKITAFHQKMVDNGTDGVLFPVGKTLNPWSLTKSIDPFKSASLFHSFHSQDPHGLTLFRLWTYTLPMSLKCKPPLVLTGPIGSGKTRSIRGIAELYGLPATIAAVEESSPDSFWPNMDHGGLYVLDNADSDCRWLPDAIAAAATGGVSNRRKLYTNNETVRMRSRSALAITSANPMFASDAGLADRLQVVRMMRAEGPTQDSKLTDEILATRDAGLSHIAFILSKALCDEREVPIGLNARHPDYADFAVKIGRALGIEREAVNALRAAETDKSRFCLELDTVAPAVLAHLDRNTRFTGDAKELLTELRSSGLDVPENLKPKGLGKRLMNLLPHLKRMLKVAKAESSRNGNIFTLEAHSKADQQCQ